MSKKESGIKVVNENKKTWTLKNEKVNISLNFTLRVDVKTELLAFAELLEAALAEVKKEISL